jgi:membrane peptidoglycan carboxypeptidase
VVERGTAKAINTPKYKIAGKTGTSQKLTERGRYIKKYHTSFAGYFPADKPQYACIVVIDEPEGAEQYGADVSAPVFRQIADRLVKQDLNIEAKPVAQRETSLFVTDIPETAGWADDYKKICEELQIVTTNTKENMWVTPNAGRYEIDWKPLNIKANTIPNLRGMTLKDAIFLLEGLQLQVYYTGKGRVKTQSLMPGNSFRKGDKITINLEGEISANTIVIARPIRRDSTQKRDTTRPITRPTEVKPERKTEEKSESKENKIDNKTERKTENKNTPRPNNEQNSKSKKGMIIYRKDKNGKTFKEERTAN